MKRSWLRMVFWGACLLQPAVSLAQVAPTTFPIKIVVPAAEHDRGDAVVSIALEGSGDLQASLQLVEMQNGERKTIPSQWDVQDSPQLWWIMSGNTPAGAERHYLLEKVARRQSPEIMVRINETESFLEVTRSGAKVLRYNTAVTPLPPDADPKYKRSGFIHPVWTPSGEIVTDRAKDYLHQLGVWLAYVGTSFEGRAPNFWDLLNGHATVQYAETQHRREGPVFGEFRVVQEHLDLAMPDSPIVALQETWDVRVWNVGQRDDYSLFDLKTTIRCAGTSPVTIKQHSWGGMAIRGAPEWYGEQCKFLTSEGKTRGQANHTRVRWCDIAGATAGVWSGMTVMSHPQNLRHPEPVRVNETIPYFCFVDSFLGDFEITPEKELVLQYRFLVHDGEVQGGQVDPLWADFASSPVAAKVVE